MKNKTLFLLPVAILLSCTNSEKSKETIGAISVKDSLRSEIDTFNIGTKFFSVQQISQTDFDKVPRPIMPDTSENKLLQKDSAFVTRLGTVLILTVGNNETISFKDNTKEESEEFCKYTYSGFLPDINQYIIFGTYIESYNYLLIDKTTGDTSYVCGYPVLSPDKKYFICGNTDLIAGFVFNGFDMYEVKDKKIKLVGQRYLNNWGPENIKWQDDSTLFAQRTVLDTTLSTMTRIDHVKLLMK
jgi:hypothetical protein